ncbi:GntR family transcriptional regulator [Ancylobacter aquaticus]|uniref:GntR family transcriptional regulator n=1 Tax=Ancylobacter aquaticus TaxID=100 RepID=A0A4R1I4Z4_ANCAQ|nr:GntR family transcriptional regulator [Ancylobacter aquaticus]TCK30404.1 GntR family transcriptional regulator [Ancylobacter aquaticus]
MSLTADQDNGLPLYQSVRQQLRADLEQGRWKPGDMLPTEAELARHFGLSVGTIRQAVLALVREGLLTRTPGRGTFVARFDTRGGFGRFFRFRDEANSPMEPSVRHLDTTLIEDGDPDIAARLQSPPGTPIYRVRRMLLGNGEPISLNISYLDSTAYPGLETLSLDDQRLYTVLERRHGVLVLRAEEDLRAGLPEESEATLLGISLSTPVMIVERTAYGHRGSVIEWRRTIGRSDKFRYHISLP